MQRTFIISGSLFAALAVIMGAFGAHGLKAQLSQEMMAIYTTAVDYHMYHALGLIMLGILAERTNAKTMLLSAAILMLLGIIVFSGSLYALSISGIRQLGAITPFGGTAFILAWLLMALAMWRHK